MTITVKGKVSAPEGLALEVIEAYAGVEQVRARIMSGTDIEMTVYGSKTLILREVSVTAGQEQRPGEQRHGTLDAPNVNKPALEEGDLDTVGDELVEAVADGAADVIEAVRRMLELHGQPEQEHAYDDLVRAHGQYEVACAAADAYEAGAERAP